MESPPQYPGAPKKSKTGLILGLTALAIVICCCGGCGLMLFLGKDVFAKGIGLAECSTAIAQQRDAVLAYANKNGGKLPARATWQDDIKPYVTPMDGGKNNMVHIPSPEEDVCDRSAGTSITYNAAVAGKKLEDIKDAYSTVLLFETPGKGRNKSVAWQEPDFQSSPILVKGERRGWIRQPIRGQAFFKNKRGQNQPAPVAGSSPSFGPVDVQSKESSGD